MKLPICRYYDARVSIRVIWAELLGEYRVEFKLVKDRQYRRTLVSKNKRAALTEYAKLLNNYVMQVAANRAQDGLAHLVLSVKKGADK
jgi:hypothetical protein